MKAERINFNSKYNIIKIHSDIVEFYIEKIGYGNLWHICGVEYDLELPDIMILDSINLAEYNKFWGEE